MTDRVHSDHPSIETLRGELVRRGGTRRPAIRVPADGAIAGADVVRLVVDGRERHAPVLDGGGDAVDVGGAYGSPRLARQREGTDHLAQWVESTGLEFGRTLLVDVVVEGFQYGVRAPGEEARYDASEPPSSDLQDIARDL